MYRFSHQIKEYQNLLDIKYGFYFANSRRKVTYDQGFNYMKRWNLDIYFEISSKTGDNVVNLFMRVAEELISKYIQLQNLKNSLSEDHLRPTPSEKKKSCC